jgi:SAM-dependent methyltransferase
MAHLPHKTRSAESVPARLRTVVKSVLPRRSRIALRKLYYLGVFFRCPVCGSSVRKLLESGYQFPVLRELEVVGGEHFENDMCPVCFASSRARLVHSYLVAESRIRGQQGPTRVLHVAPERGIAEWLMQLQAVDYIAADLAPEQYEYPPSMKVDVTRIQFPDAQFDLVVCNHVLEHVPDDGVAMREIYRVLKPGGSAILQVPISAKLTTTLEDPMITDPRERERVFGQRDHVRIYAADYAQRLTRAGFLVRVFDPVKQWGIDAVSRLRLNPREKIFIGRKV